MTFTTKTYDEIVNDIVRNLLTKEQKTTDFNLQSIIRSLIESYALELKNEDEDGLIDKISQVYNSTKLATATDGDLTDIAALVGIVRKSGTKASVQETFEIMNPLTTSITIPQGTQFGTTDGSVKFSTDSVGTFTPSLSETYTRVPGINLYTLNQRFGTNYSISGLTEGSDYTIDSKASRFFARPSSVVEIASCDNASQFTGVDATLVTDTTSSRTEGTGCIDIRDSNSSYTASAYKNLTTPIDLSTGKQVCCSVYIDSSILSHIDSLKLSVGNYNAGAPTTLYQSFSSLVEGWNDLNISTIESESSGGIVNTAQIDYIELEITKDVYTQINTTTLLRMDFFFYANLFYKTCDVIVFPDPQTSSSSFTITYSPLSWDITSSSSEIGTDQNVAPNMLIKKISSMPKIVSINNYESANEGTNVESDVELRERVLENRDVGAKATASAIKIALSNLDYVKDVTIENPITKTVTGETFTVDLTNGNSLEKFLAISTGFEFHVGATLYTAGSDYILNYDNTISYPDTTSITDGATATINYSYALPGKFLVHISTNSDTYEPYDGSDHDLEIIDTIDSYKAAGIIYNIEKIETLSVDIVADVAFSTGNVSTYSTQIRTALTDKIKEYGIGDSIVYSQLEAAVKSIEGVLAAHCYINGHESSTITVYDSDLNPLTTIGGYEIPSDTEVFRVGTITINEMKLTNGS